MSGALPGWVEHASLIRLLRLSSAGDWVCGNRAGGIISKLLLLFGTLSLVVYELSEGYSGVVGRVITR